MIFSLFKVKPIKNKILKIDIKKNSSKKFSQYVKEISTKTSKAKLIKVSKVQEVMLQLFN